MIKSVSKRIMASFMAMAMLIGMFMLPTSAAEKKSPEYGNTVGNLNQGGLKAYKDGWVYSGGTSLSKFPVADILKKDKNIINIIEKVSAGPNNLNLIENINIIGDWIYYTYTQQQEGEYNGDFLYSCKCSIEKIKTDGTGRKKLHELDNDSQYLALTVVDDWIYYSTNDHYFYKMKTDGTKKTTLLKSNSPKNINIADDWIYYKSDKGIYKTTIDGKKNTELCKFDKSKYSIEDMQVAGNRIYYIKSTKDYKNPYIYSVGTNGKQNAKLASSFKGDIYDMNISGNRIYFVGKKTGDENIYHYKMNIDGTKVSKIFSFNTVKHGNLFVLGDWINVMELKADGSSNGKYIKIP